MIKYKVVLLPFPFDDLSSVKVRPVVCLTEKIGPYEHTIVAFITSKIPTDFLASDIVLDSQHPEFASLGLKVTSALRLHRLMTIHTSLIQRELGMVPAAFQTEIREKLKQLFLEE